MKKAVSVLLVALLGCAAHKSTQTMTLAERREIMLTSSFGQSPNVSDADAVAQAKRDCGSLGLGWEITQYSVSVYDQTDMGSTATQCVKNPAHHSLAHEVQPPLPPCPANKRPDGEVWKDGAFVGTVCK